MGNGVDLMIYQQQLWHWNYRDSGSNWLPTNVPSGGATGSYDGKGGMWYKSQLSFI